MSNKPAQRVTKPESGLQAVHLRNTFYRDGYRASQTISVLLALGLIISILGNIFQASRSAPPPVYFATTPSGSLIPMAPLDDPLLNPTQLANWVQEAVTSAYTLDAKNYVQQIQRNERFFTSEGFEQYRAALSDSQQLKVIKEKVMITSAVPDGVPVVVDTGRSAQGALMWKMQMPVTVEYTSAKERYVQKLIVTLVTMRRPTTENPMGVGITQLIARPA